MRWLHYGQLILGLWVAVAPWLLGFTFVTPAFWSSIVAGVLMALLALWSMLGED
ncbi:MAG: SPW repeat protein [bacterium]|nr:SPW repeat protein [bacterium]